MGSRPHPRDDLTGTRLSSRGQSAEALELESPQSQTYATAMSFPDGGRRAWLVVLSSFCLIAATFGMTGSIGIFQSYWQSHQLSAYSSRDIAWISSTQIFLTLFLGVQVGPLFDRYGPRWLTLVGSVGCVSYLILLGQCTKYWHFLLCFGVLGGVSGAILTTVALSVISHWFKARRGLATGITFTGTSLGGIVFPIALSSIFKHMSWAWSMRLLALVEFVLVLIGNLFVRGRLPIQKHGGVINLWCFKDSRFAWTTVGISCMRYPDILSDILAELGDRLRIRALYCYRPPSNLRPRPGFWPADKFQCDCSHECVESHAPYITSLVLTGISGSGLGRYIAGLVADHYGRFNSMNVSILISLFATLALWLPIHHNIVLFYVMVPTFGFGSGSVMSLAPVCIGELGKVSEYGQRYGTSYSVVGIVWVSFGPPP